MTPEEFKTIRLKSGKSQAALALILGVSHGRISNWEMGYQPIPAEYATAMSAGAYSAVLYISANDDSAKEIINKELK